MVKNRCCRLAIDVAAPPTWSGCRAASKEHSSVIALASALRERQGRMLMPLVLAMLLSAFFFPFEVLRERDARELVHHEKNKMACAGVNNETK